MVDGFIKKHITLYFFFWVSSPTLCEKARLVCKIVVKKEKENEKFLNQAGKIYNFFLGSFLFFDISYFKHDIHTFFISFLDGFRSLRIWF